MNLETLSHDYILLCRCKVFDNYTDTENHMNVPSTDSKVYLCCQPVDMRKAIDGLAAIVQTQLLMDPFENCLYVFCNRTCDKCKILHWSGNGWWLYYRKLSKGTFRWKFEKGKRVLLISQRQFSWLMDGMEMEQPQAHKEVKQRIFI